jgi:urease accessory protein
VRDAAAPAEIFAANRARGRVALVVAAAQGVTRRADVAEQGPLRVRFPRPLSPRLEAVLVNTAGGIAGGDRLSVDVAVGAGARLTLTSTAAEKVYRALGPEAEIDVRLEVGAQGQLAWLPQETILFDRARLVRRIDVELARDASLVLCEAVVFGRAAMGEAVNEGFLLDRWRVRRNGRLAFADALRLDGAIAQKLARPAIAAGGAALATVLIVPADEGMVSTLRGLEARGEVAASAWNGIALARLVARDGAALRHDLVALLTALGQEPARLWLN